MIFAGIIGIVLVLLVLLMFCNEPCVHTQKDSAILLPFRRAAAGIYRLTLRDNDFSKALFIKLLPERNPSEEAKKYTIGKLSQTLLLILLGSMVIIGAEWLGLKDGLLYENQRIQRPDYKEDEMKTVLIAKTTSGREQLPLTIYAQQYDEATFCELSKTHLQTIVTDVLGENTETGYICKDLNFTDVTFPEAYPFDVDVSCDNRTLITEDGALTEEITTEGNEMNIVIEISYGDYSYEERIPIVVYPKILTENETFVKKLTEAVNRAEDSSRQEEQFHLPVTIDEQEITWEEQKSGKTLLPGVLIIIAGVANFVLRNADIKKRIKKRETELKEDYALIVSKLGIFLGAGIPVKEAFRKIVFDYEAENTVRRAAYEEMSMAVREMESGVAEVRAYENFGKRCGNKEYVKFGMLLSSHCKKGNAGMLSELQKEGERAWEENKADARRKGEEAGTKLLFPMLLFLLIVMIVIMIPAFSSFSL